MIEHTCEVAKRLARIQARIWEQTNGAAIDQPPEPPQLDAEELDARCAATKVTQEIRKQGHRLYRESGGLRCDRCGVTKGWARRAYWLGRKCTPRMSAERMVKRQRMAETGVDVGAAGASVDGEGTLAGGKLVAEEYRGTRDEDATYQEAVAATTGGGGIEEERPPRKKARWHCVEDEDGTWRWVRVLDTSDPDYVHPNRQLDDGGSLQVVGKVGSEIQHLAMVSQVPQKEGKPYFNDFDNLEGDPFNLVDLDSGCADLETPLGHNPGAHMDELLLDESPYDDRCGVIGGNAVGTVASAHPMHPIKRRRVGEGYIIAERGEEDPPETGDSGGASSSTDMVTSSRTAGPGDGRQSDGDVGAMHLGELADAAVPGDGHREAKRRRLSRKTKPHEAAGYAVGVAIEPSRAADEANAELVTRNAAAAIRKRHRELVNSHRRAAAAASDVAWRALYRDPGRIRAGEAEAPNERDPIGDEAESQQSDWNIHPSHVLRKSQGVDWLYCKTCGAFTTGRRCLKLREACSGIRGHLTHLKLLSVCIRPGAGARLPARLRVGGARGSRGGAAASARNRLRAGAARKRH